MFEIIGKLLTQLSKILLGSFHLSKIMMNEQFSPVTVNLVVFARDMNWLV